jgi:O-antigen ligase
MMAGTFLTVLTAALVPISPMFMLLPVALFFYVHSHWMVVSALSGALVYLLSRNKAVALALVLAMALFALYNAGEVRGNLKSPDNRLSVWKQTVKFANQHPVTGWGMGTYPYIFPGLSKNFVPGQAYASAHNDWLQSAFDLGYTGLAFIVAAFITLFHRLKKAKAYGALAGLTMIAVVMCAHFPLRMPQCVPITIVFLAFCERKAAV